MNGPRATDESEGLVGAPLSGLRVIDLSRHLAGPFAAMSLGDLGADVIKVERPGNGDDTRGMPPFWNGVSCYYLAANRNKRSITLDLGKPAGRRVLLRLIRTADVLIENFKTGTMERWRIGPRRLLDVNPRLIYCAISAAGRDGPDRNRQAVDLVMQAYGGLMSITGEPGGPPVRVGQSVADLTAGANAVQAILAALLVRERTGRGQLVESSLLEGQLSWLAYHIPAFYATGQPPSRLGSRHASLAPYAAYPTADHDLVIAVATEPAWSRFCVAIGRPDLAGDPRFLNNSARCEHRAELDQILDLILRRRGAREWETSLAAAGVPASMVNNLETVLGLEQVAHRRMVVPVPTREIPELQLAGIAIRLSETPGAIRRPPPSLGEHTEEILAEAGLTERDIERLRKSDAC